jgi:hypothetical protein
VKESRKREMEGEMEGLERVGLSEKKGERDRWRDER